MGGALAGHRRFEVVAALALAAAIALVYAPVAGYPFVSLDDDIYVADNPLVSRGLTPGDVARAFTDTHVGAWVPLTWLSFMVEVDLFGMAPGAMHVTNVLLHAANSALLLILLSRLTMRRLESAVVAALFALHPSAVEAVAWVTARKDVLSTFFLFLSLLAYLGYCRRRGGRRYALFVALFALSLMAKATGALFALVLLLLDFWPLGRAARAGRPSGAEFPGRPPAASGAPPMRLLLLEKVPPLALGSLAALMNIIAHARAGSLAPFGSLPPGSRPSLAVLCYVGYVGKLFRPSALAVAYPPWGEAPSPWAAAAAAFFVGAAGVWVVRWRLSRPFLAVGGGWYAVSLLPVAGLAQNGPQMLDDRFAYVPFVGLFLAGTWAFSEIAARFSRREALLAGAASCAIFGCLLATPLHVRRWRDGMSLYSHAVAVDDDNHLAHTSLAGELLWLGRAEEALVHSRKALKLRPEDARARANAGIALALRGDLEEAVTQLRMAVALDPRNWRAQRSLDTALKQLARRHALPQGAPQPAREGPASNRQSPGAEGPVPRVDNSEARE